MKSTKNNGAETVQPYLFFDGRCEEAIEFYRKALGAEVTMLTRFKDSPEPPQPGMCAPGSGDKIMHASLRIGNTTVLASDGRCNGKPNFEGFSLSFTASNEEETEKLFGSLYSCGQDTKTPAQTLSYPRFVMGTRTRSSSSG